MSREPEEQDPHHFPPMPPPVPPERTGHRPPPSTVTTAATLWTITGAFLSLAFGLATFQAFGNGNLGGALAAGVFTAVAVVLWRLGNGLRHGRDNRKALTVLGALSALTILPLVLVVPAIVLQHRPASSEWFALPAAEPPSA